MIDKKLLNVIRAILPGARCSLQILNNVMIKDGRITVTDLDRWLTGPAPADLAPGLYRGDMIKKTGDFIPADFPITDFPDAPDLAGYISDMIPDFFDLPFESYAAVDATRTSLKCICMTPAGTYATDGHKLIARNDGPYQWNTLIPCGALKAIRTMKKMVNRGCDIYARSLVKIPNATTPADKEKGTPETVAPMAPGDNGAYDLQAGYAEFTAGEYRLLVKCNDDGAPPNFKEAIPTSYKMDPITPAEYMALTDAVKMALPYCNEQTGKIIFDGHKLIAYDRNRTLDKRITLPRAFFNIRIGFNVHFLLNILTDAGPGVSIGYSTNLSAVLFNPAPGGKHPLTFLIMPLRLIDGSLPEDMEEKEPDPEDNKDNAPDPEPEPQAAPQAPDPEPEPQAAPQAPDPEPEPQAAPQAPTPGPSNKKQLGILRGLVSGLTVDQLSDLITMALNFQLKNKGIQ